MIDRLGRMFRVWKVIDAQLRTLASAKTLSDDEVRRLRSQVSDLQAQLNEAILDGRKSREMVADWIAQNAYGKPVYAPHALPPDAPPGDSLPAPRRIHGRELVHRAEREVYEALANDARDRTPAA